MTPNRLSLDDTRGRRVTSFCYMTTIGEIVVTIPYSDEDFLLPDTIVVAKIPSIVFLVPRVGIIPAMFA